MMQKSPKNVKSQPTGNLVEISSKSDSEGDVTCVRITKGDIQKGNDAIVAESGSETDDTSYLDIYLKKIALMNIWMLHFLIQMFILHVFQIWQLPVQFMIIMNS